MAGQAVAPRAGRCSVRGMRIVLDNASRSRRSDARTMMLNQQQLLSRTNQIQPEVAQRFHTITDTSRCH